MSDWSTGYQLLMQGAADGARRRQTRAALAAQMGLADRQLQQQTSYQGGLLDLQRDDLANRVKAQTQLKDYRDRALGLQADQQIADQQLDFLKLKAAVKPPEIPETPQAPQFFTKPDAQGNPVQFLRTFKPGGGWSDSLYEPKGAELPNLTEAQAKAAKFGGLMGEATDKIDELAKKAKPTALTHALVGALPLVSNYFHNKAYQTYRSAANAWSLSNLRNDSGAVLGEDEQALAFRIFFPQPGDNEDTVAFKDGLRKKAQEGINRGVPQMIPTLSGRPVKVEEPAVAPPQDPPRKFLSIEEAREAGAVGEQYVYDRALGFFRKMSVD